LESGPARKCLAIVLFAGATFCSACRPGGTFTLPDDPMVGKPAPPFSFHSVHKRTFPSTNFLGKTLVMAFIRPGQPEAPTLVRELEALHKDPVFAAVEFVAFAPEDDPLTEPFWVGLKTSIPVALDFTGVAAKYGAGSLPLVVVADYKGTIRLRLDGYLGEEFWPRFRATRKVLEEVELQRVKPSGAR
jgi:hypothetical protein